MKAITCSQCGAVIKRIHLKDKLAYCAYCNATMTIQKERVVEIEDKSEKVEAKKLTNWEIYQKRRKEVENKYIPHISGPDDSIDRDSAKKMFLFVLGLALLILLPVLLTSFFSSSPETSPVDLQTRNTEAPTPCPGAEVFVFDTYFGKDSHTIAAPKLDLSKLPTCNVTELKTTVFSDQNNSVKVELIVGTDGRVIQAKAVSGHDFLRDAAEKAARESIFIKRKKQEDRELTYIFTYISTRD